MSKPRPISDLVPGLTKDILGRQGAQFGKMLSNWADIVGADIAAKTVPLELKYVKKLDKKSQAILHLAVQSAYALELSYQKSLLIERLNIHFGYAAIKDIKMVQQNNVMNNKKRVAAPKRPLTMQEEKALDEMVGGIQENDLQMALKNLGKAISTRKNTKD